MILTKKRLRVIITRYEEAISYADHFRDRLNIRRVWETRFDNDGYPEYNVNTSCHCHPVYEWVPLTPEQKVEWDKCLSER